jgi:hypothetical protein
VGCIEVWDIFKKIIGCIFFNIYELIRKFIDSGIFGRIVTKFEVFFGKLWSAYIFSQKFRGSHVKSWTTNIFSWMFRVIRLQTYFPECLGVILKNPWTSGMILVKWKDFSAKWPLFGWFVPSTRLIPRPGIADDVASSVGFLISQEY